jgi:hypothetical protein
MFVVNAYSDQEFEAQHTLLVEPNFNGKPNNTTKDFLNEFKEVLSAVKKEDGEASFSRVVSKLEKMGWQIIYADTVDVEY